MKRHRRLISFDWSMKRLLRSKAHFGILEGFLTELLRQEIQILEILESERNKETAADKQNRVDLKARNAGGEIILIEVQYQRQFDFDLGQGEDYIFHVPPGLSVCIGRMNCV